MRVSTNSTLDVHLPHEVENINEHDKQYDNKEDVVVADNDDDIEVSFVLIFLP